MTKWKVGQILVPDTSAPRYQDFIRHNRRLSDILRIRIKAAPKEEQYVIEVLEVARGIQPLGLASGGWALNWVKPLPNASLKKRRKWVNLNRDK